MAKGDIETYFEDGVWKVRPQGNKRATAVFRVKVDATAFGRELAIARGVEHIIKKKDGTIGERNTYPRGRDPRASKG